VNFPRQLLGVLRCALERFDELSDDFVERVRFIVEENNLRWFFGENLVVFANLFEWFGGHQVKCSAFRLIFFNKILKRGAVINGKKIGVTQRREGAKTKRNQREQSHSEA
jgi:hypothetical protein